MTKLNKKNKKTYVRYVYPLVFVVVALFIIQVVVSNRYIHSGLVIGELEEKAKMLSEENETLKQEIASASSLLTLENKAKTLGFEENTSYIIVAPQLPVALESIKD